MRELWYQSIVVRLLFRRFAVVFVACVLVLAVGESYFRIRESAHVIPRDRLVPDALLGWVPRPDFSFSLRTSEFSVSDSTNSLGMLGPEVSQTRAPGALRVLALGDSITEGVQVPREDRFVSLIAAGLSVADRSAEVLNAGVANYQTDQEVLYYESRGSRLRSDV